MIKFHKIKGNLKKRLPELCRVFSSDSRVAALYVFGSYARNRIKPLSDIDIAVLLKENIRAYKYWDIKINLLSKAMQILGTDEIDFVILNEAPPELAYNICKDGRLLFCRDKKSRSDFQERIVMNYLDTQALREEGLFHLRERIKKGRFGNDQGRYKKDIANIRRIFREIKTPRKDSLS